VCCFESRAQLTSAYSIDCNCRTPRQCDCTLLQHCLLDVYAACLSKLDAVSQHAGCRTDVLVNDQLRMLCEPRLPRFLPTQPKEKG
jgi:hypothetical protein